ncbi:MAG: copper amine oxidase N-terminal domain-containing protein [Defluviitaleaceae bacterium]|nr:copper amine oxidase N-terminal domain-containing protein [Defluviitaleaceae bacterium]
MVKKCGIVFLFSITLLILVGCRSNRSQSELVTSYWQGGYPWIRESIDELAWGATHIVKAEVLDSRTELINTVLSDREISEDEEERVILPHTVHQLRVLEVFMGTAAIGEIIEVAQLGGRVGNRELIYDHQVQLIYGDELIFFLHCYESRGFRPMPMALESASQAIYIPAPPGSSPDTVLENFSPENDLILTLGELERIARPSPQPTSRPPAGNNTGSGQTPEETQEPTPTPSPQPTSSPTPPPNNEGDDIEEEDAPLILLRFVIGSLYYTNHEGETLIGDAEPFIAGNRAHVPLRIIAEALGAEVTWNRSTRTGYMTKDDITVSIVVNQPLPDGMGMPVIINNRTFVPARYISETFGAEVRWDRDNSAVYVYWPQ